MRARERAEWSSESGRGERQKESGRRARTAAPDHEHLSALVGELAQPGQNGPE